MRQRKPKHQQTFLLPHRTTNETKKKNEKKKRKQNRKISTPTKTEEAMRLSTQRFLFMNLFRENETSDACETAHTFATLSASASNKINLTLAQHWSIFLWVCAQLKVSQLSPDCKPYESSIQNRRNWFKLLATINFTKGQKVSVIAQVNGEIFLLLLFLFLHNFGEKIEIPEHHLSLMPIDLNILWAESVKNNV